jgi:hypothetical protein
VSFPKIHSIRFDEALGRSGYAGQPFIMVMQSANVRELEDRTPIRRVHRSRVRAIHVQRQVRAPTMVVVEVGSERPPEMALAEYDDVVEAVAADAADQAFNVGILPRTPRGGENLFDAHAFDAPLEWVSKDRIAIP